MKPANHADISVHWSTRNVPTTFASSERCPQKSKTRSHRVLLLGQGNLLTLPLCCPYRALTGSRKHEPWKALNSGQYSKNYSARYGSCTNGLLAPPTRTHHHTFVLNHDALCLEFTVQRLFSAVFCTTKNCRREEGGGLKWPVAQSIPELSDRKTM